MKVFLVIKISHGEIPVELDKNFAFDTQEKARKKLNELYEEVLEDVEGYDIIDNYKSNDAFTVSIDDDEGSVYEGYVKEVEVQ